jgi:WD40 repeat protein/uncharacterized caspase-like protein
MRAARDGGDTRAEDRLFRALVIARWQGDALILALRGLWFGSGFGGEITTFLLEGGRKLKLVSQTGHRRAIRLISFGADGSRLITSADDGWAISWVAATGEVLHTFWLDSVLVREPVGVALSPDGRWMVVAGNGDLGFHFPLRGVEPQRNETEYASWKAARFVAFSADGARFFASGAETSVWKIAAEALADKRSFGEPEDAKARVAAFSPRGDRVLTAGLHHEAVLWNADTGERLQTLAGHAAPLAAAAFSADGARVATLDTAGVVILWDAHTAARLLDLTTTDGPSSIALSPEGRLLLTLSPTGGARLLELDAQPPAPRARIADALGRIKGTITAAALSPSVERPLLIVGTAEGALHAIDYERGELAWSVEAARLAPTSIDFADGGHRFTVNREDGTAHVWDPESGGLVEVRAAAPRAPSLVLESIFAGQVIRDRETGEEIGYYESHLDTKPSPLVRVERLAPMGRWLLTRADGRVSVLDEKPQPGQWLLVPECAWNATIAHLTTSAISPDGRFVLGGTPSGTVELWKVGEPKRLCTTLSLDDGQWAVADDEGRYDASQGGRATGLHWVLDMEPIELSQLKLRYYDPTLLTKKMLLRAEPLRAVTRAAPRIFPAVKTAVVTTPAGVQVLRVTVADRGGGIGTVRIAINGKEAFAGRLGRSFGLSLMPEGPGISLRVEPRFSWPGGPVREIEFDFKLTGHPYLLPGDPRNQVTVVAMDADDVLASRGVAARFPVAPRAEAVQPTLWAVVAGISRYQDPALQLTYSGKDAVDFGKALELAGATLFEGRVHIKVLSTDSRDTAEWPTRANIEAAFRGVAQAAKSEDVLVVYLSGHGVQASAGKGDELYYLTQDAVAGARADPVVWRDSTLSGEELTTLIKAVPALKQVLVLDTCHAGRLVANLLERREVPSSYQRAVERMKDRTGLFVLAGTAADAVSYEASRYAQGLLTYALLQGMRGPALREGKFIDVAALHGYAVEEVPRLAEGIGGVQRPLLAAGGASFDIGAVDADTRARIALAAARPVVERSSFQDEELMDDVLALGEMVDAALRDLAAARPPPFVFVEGTGMPDALRPAGRYSRGPGGAITVTMRSFHDHALVDERVVEGSVAALDALVRRVAEVVAESLRGQRAPQTSNQAITGP